MKLFITLNADASSSANEIVIDAVYASKEKCYVLAHQGEVSVVGGERRYEIDLDTPEGMSCNVPVEVYCEGVNREWLIDNWDAVILDNAPANAVLYARDNDEVTERLNAVYAQLDQLHCCYSRPDFKFSEPQNSADSATSVADSVIIPYTVEINPNEITQVHFVHESVWVNEAHDGVHVIGEPEEANGAEAESGKSDSEEAESSEAEEAELIQAEAAKLVKVAEEVKFSDAEHKKEVVVLADEVVGKKNAELPIKSQKQGYFSQQSLLRGALFFGAAVTVGVVALAVNHCKNGALKI